MYLYYENCVMHLGNTVNKNIFFSALPDLAGHVFL